jgi:hypothetical protein
MWDNKINEFLDDPKFTNLCEHYVQLNGRKIWIANHPYACCTPCTNGAGVMPSRATVWRFFDALSYAITNDLVK